ncbi:MAG: NnrU family protein [Pseudomonadales bacterium]|nr:NnrU family protein [Pseudomonadales bacterium]|tara:strand:- start:688 stop:840 length:153 start_codon:yes stop_codon:yes gene_type:complete
MVQLEYLFQFSKMGEGAHKGVYSLAALAGLGLMIYGKAYAEFVPVWSPPE